MIPRLSKQGNDVRALAVDARNSIDDARPLITEGRKEPAGRPCGSRLFGHSRLNNQPTTARRKKTGDGPEVRSGDHPSTPMPPLGWVARNGREPF